MYCCVKTIKKKSQALAKKKKCVMFIGGGLCKFNVDRYSNKIPSNF